MPGAVFGSGELKTPLGFHLALRPVRTTTIRTGHSIHFNSEDFRRNTNNFRKVCKFIAKYVYMIRLPLG